MFIIRISSQNINQKKKGVFMTFSEAIKHYFSLGYDERMAWQKEFINQAKTVKDLQFVLGHVDRKHRTEIVQKMREVAATDEEKRIVSFYRI